MNNIMNTLMNTSFNENIYDIVQLLSYFLLQLRDLILHFNERFILDIYLNHAWYFIVSTWNMKTCSVLRIVENYYFHNNSLIYGLYESLYPLRYFKHKFWL